VGEEPESVSAVRRANVGRAEHTPFRIEPEVGKVAEDMLEPSVSGLNNVGDVLQEHESRCHVTDDAFGHRPQVPFIVTTTSDAGSGERLAG